MAASEHILHNRALHDALQEHAKVDGTEMILIRWAVVCDWQDDDGSRSLTRVKSEGSTSWEFEGLMQASLDFDADVDDDF